MRVLIVAGLAGTALVALAACSKPASTTGATAGPPAASAPASGPVALQDLPHRKAGLWRQTMSLEGMDRTMPATEACTDAASEAKLSLLGQHKSKDLCQTQSFSRNLDGSISFGTTCDQGAHGKTVSNGTISGDFNSGYKIAMDSTTTGSPTPQANGEHKMTITATWVGACKPGQRGGDLILPNGRTINLTDPAPSLRYP